MAERRLSPHLGLAAAAAALFAALALAVFGRAPHRATVAASPLPAQRAVPFSLSLRVANGPLDRYLAGVPAQLSAAELGVRFGPSLATLARLRDVLERHHVRVLGGYPQRTALDAVATAAAVERLFSVRLDEHVGPGGQRYYAPLGTPRIPSWLRGSVTGVVGLDSEQRLLPADVPSQGMDPELVASAYDVAPLLSLGDDGIGLSIAIASFQHFDDGDVATYASRFGVKGPAPEHVAVSGGATVSGDDEADLDVEVVRAIAPAAQVLVYEAPSTDLGEVELLNRIVASGVRVASMSWGQCDTSADGVSGSYRQAVERALEEAAAAGTTFFIASGDSGAYDCQRDDFSDHQLSVDFPSDTPFDVSVGGTLLSVDTDGGYAGESAWNDPFEYAGGGGGIDNRDARPTWQADYKIGSASGRGVPDVSAAASGGSPWDLELAGQRMPASGTSAAAPFWAAAMLLAEQYAAAGAHPGGCFLAPVLYTLAETHQPFAAFHDVISGSNRYYPARPGWDYATGLGSPDVYALARDLAAYERAHPGCGRA
jgi:kumamolisin